MASSKKFTARKSKKAASIKTAGSASATISIASKRKKSKNHEEESEKGLKLLKHNCRNPPQDYKFINADHWTQFVTERTKPTFLELPKTQQACRRMNKSKGYVGLVAELKEKAKPAQAEPEEASTISSEDELCDMCETWVAARVTKEGKFADEETQKKAEEIIELKEKVSTRETSLSGYNDVLENALGKEHSGRV
ncbi:hypothetical protein ACLB2K_031437 [Fragaria x ananassa]